jgi:hypothetical protein
MKEQQNGPPSLIDVMDVIAIDLDEMAPEWIQPVIKPLWAP